MGNPKILVYRYYLCKFGKEFYERRKGIL